ncbi:ribosome biogenesis GTP-binding protein YihA/YsxC [Solimonas marina]|uniref:Probable GTP-binding protein EngB n=1 Tax=Solimonas marina TaxID=2714601 RepID=A0A969W8T0_9GAMM|nr:ribosome biogenesis GTP-binding protein YihA/YsxC [Solimonas marina]NKF21046.1 YihA family ribosome biogenesis GTP-binding protein [Solimonas marina]
MPVDRNRSTPTAGDRGAANPFAGATFVLSCAKLAQLPADGLPEIAFAGRSNAGKSSAMNVLCGQKQLARVSKTPGRTQLINMFDVPGGRFADLPGYGFAKVPKDISRAWGQLIGDYLQGRANLRGIVQIMDIRHPLTDFDVQMLEWSAHRGLRCLVLLTKADKLRFGAAKNTLLKVQRALGELPDVQVQLFSSTSRLGLDDARQTLHDWLVASAPVD